MRFEVMDIKDIDAVIPLYMEYYNNHEGDCWTEETVKRRIQQVLKIDDSYSLMMKDDEGEVCGFVMGYYKQYDDIVGYTLEEILIAHKHQNKGYGSALLAEVEARVKEAGASCLELQAVKDEMHERYYGKAGYRDAKNFALKVRWFE
ncbi:MAG: GNAT family N-acetyltransferase [Lachnospiraceae bacterium]|nr:GNAT family N-acetyltransferase [Lachnospiraceae bacterium]